MSTNTAAYPQKGSMFYLYSIVMVAVIGGLLFGYDTAVISGAERGLQAFFLGATDFVYTKGLHGFTASSALIGCIIGSALSGFFAGTYGRKRSLMIAGVFFFVSALGSYYPEFLVFEKGKPTAALLAMFNFYRIIGGIGVGLASAVCPMYIAEVAPSHLRGKLVSWNQFAIIFGQLVVYAVNMWIMDGHKNPGIIDPDSIGSMTNAIVLNANEIQNSFGIMSVLPGSESWTIETGWRYMFGSEAYVAGIFTLLVCFVPMSPRFLALKGKDDKALYVLARINGIAKAREILHDIKNSEEVKSDRLLAFGWMVIFVGIMLSVFQQAVGINAVLYYAPRIFDSMNMGDPMVQTVIMGIVNIAFTLVAIFTVEKLGRKPLLIYGSIGMAVGAFGVCLPNIVALPPIVSVASIMIYSACFMFSWGPICWVLISEIFPNTIRSAAVAIAVAFQWIFNFIVSSTFVPMYEMKLGDMGVAFGHVFTYGLYGVICIVAAWFVWKLVPETKGKTLEDMTQLWLKRKNKA